MKKLILIPLLLLATIFSIVFNSNDVHAVEIDTELQFNKTLYQIYEYDPNTQLDYMDIYLQVGNTNADLYYRNLQDISLGLQTNSINNADRYIFILNPNYLIQLYRGSGINRSFYDDIGYVSMIYASYAAADYELSFYDENNEFITTIRPFDLPYDDIFLHTSYINQSASIENAFETGKQQGYDNGYNVAKREYGMYINGEWVTASVYGSNRYNAGITESRQLYGYFDGTNWLTAEQWGDIRYNDGYEVGSATEIDWFSWSMTFFLMPFRIMNIQVLPGIRIGYFALFSLLLGVVGWFFFIVGKGGGRKK